MALILPNVKTIFLVDEGMELADLDYSAADLRIVVWDSNCRFWKDYFKSGNKQKPYAYMISQFYGRTISEEEDYYKVAKAVFHSLNYAVGVTKLAKMAGIPYEIGNELAKFYFTLCPEIKQWQKHIEYQVKTYGYLDTVYGRRRWFLKSNDPNLLNKAVSFRPQSSIADLVNKSWIAIRRALPDVQVLLQVHDSLVVQYPVNKAEEYRPRLIELMQQPVPYKPEALIIPAAIKVSRQSYGQTEKVK